MHSRLTCDHRWAWGGGKGGTPAPEVQFLFSNVRTFLRPYVLYSPPWSSNFDFCLPTYACDCNFFWTNWGQSKRAAFRISSHRSLTWSTACPPPGSPPPSWRPRPHPAGSTSDPRSPSVLKITQHGFPAKFDRLKVFLITRQNFRRQGNGQGLKQRPKNGTKQHLTFWKLISPPFHQLRQFLWSLFITCGEADRS